MKGLDLWQQDVQGHVVQQWWKLADALIVKYNDGFLNDVSVGFGT